MSFDDDLNACAALVEKGDPMRFRAAMAAPVAARRVLFPLYAFNVEVARAPWLTQEAMIAEMRLQWWRDVCEEIVGGGPVRRHEVATPLAALIGPAEAMVLDELVAARRWDIYRDAFENEDRFFRYIDQTAGNLAWVAASLLGPADEAVVRQAARAAGLANWFLAVPELEAAGRVPLVDGTREAIGTLARDALQQLRQARQSRHCVSKPARAALLHVGQAVPVLRAVAADPGLIARGELPDVRAIDQRRLAWRAISGRW